MYYDQDLHLFVTDEEIYAIYHLKPMVQTWRRETLEPVLPLDEKKERPSIGYASAIYDLENNQIKLWYVMDSDQLIRLASSEDGRSWTKHGIVMENWPQGEVDNLHVTLPSRGIDSWFREARFVGTAHFNPSQKIGGREKGIYGIRSLDGERWEVRLPPILPIIGDRTAMTFDTSRAMYMLTSRPPYWGGGGGKVDAAGKVAKIRKVALWESQDMVNWEEKGIVLRADENDDEDLQLYGMVPFRYGSGFLGLLEVYHQDIERLDTQLAYSPDGLYWQRVRRRETILSCGGEGSWDSHWAAPTLNPPLIANNRLLFFYNGASTKHGSEKTNRRTIGMASLRKDGWVSLEAGRTEGQVMTTELPLDSPRQLEVNVSCPSGYFSAEVLHSDGKPIEKYEQDKNYLEKVDMVRHRVKWKNSTTVAPTSEGLCRLRFTLYQGSFFSYRWSKVS